MEVCQDVGAWEKIIKNSLDIICTIDPNGYIINVNEACKRILGYECEELTGRKFEAFIHREDLPESFAIVQDIIRGYKTNSFENRCIHKSGKEVYFVWSGVWSEEDKVILCVGRDVTEQKFTQQKLREKDELYHALVEHGSDMLALFDEDLNYLYCGGSTARKLGYRPEQLVGTNALSFIHPEDIPKVYRSFLKVLISGENDKVSDFRYKDTKGAWRWLETSLSNQLHNPAVKALVASSRDITERIHNRLRLEESEQRFKSLFDHHLDMVLFKDKEGVIVDVNPATLSFLGIQKQAIINRPFSDFLSPERIPVYEQALQDALKGKSVRFETKVPFKGKGLYSFDIAKIPVKVNGEIIGLYCILRDVTEISHSNSIIRRQAEKLNTILESITDAFFTLDRNWHFTYVNSEFERLFQKNRKELLGKNVWDLYQDEFEGEFYRQYHLAVETGQTVDFEAYFRELDMWLQVKAFPSEEGLSVFLDDITERVKAKQKLEKLSLVASRTINGVVIQDAEGHVEWVNEGFTRLTGYTFSEVAGKFPGAVLTGEETDKATVNRIKENLEKDKPFSEEVLIYRKTGEKAWFLLDFTPILNDVGELTNFIVLETDITFRKEAEASQLQLTQDLFRQNQDLQQFTYMISHNLRAPVSSALGLVDILNTFDKDSDDFLLSLEYLKASIHQLDTVLKDLNMILSVRDKRSVIDKEKVYLAQLLQQVIAALKEPLMACGGEVFMDIEESVYVHGNKAYLHSIFYHLLLNAIKFRSAERALKISIKCFGSTERGTILSLSDNGSGFDMDLAGDKVFRLYKRFHTNTDGRGIGLYLVKTQVEAMGGHIEVRSQINLGTRFLIYLK